MTILYALIAAALILSAFQALRTKSLLASALWLAATSGLVSLLMYLLGSSGIAVVELSVGAGLVTVLFVFVISMTGSDDVAGKPLFPQWLAVLLVFCSFGTLGFIWITNGFSGVVLHTEPADILADTIWVDRQLDLYIQAALIITGVLGLMMLLAPSVAKKLKKQRRDK